MSSDDQDACTHINDPLPRFLHHTPLMDYGSLYPSVQIRQVVARAKRTHPAQNKQPRHEDDEENIKIIMGLSGCNAKIARAAYIKYDKDVFTAIQSISK